MMDTLNRLAPKFDLNKFINSFWITLDKSRHGNNTCEGSFLIFNTFLFTSKTSATVASLILVLA